MALICRSLPRTDIDPGRSAAKIEVEALMPQSKVSSCPAAPPLVLVVSSDDACLAAARSCSSEDLEWHHCPTVDGARRELAAHAFDVVLVDASRIGELRDLLPSIAVIVLADAPSAETAFELARQGADELLQRADLTTEALRTCVRRAIERRGRARSLGTEYRALLDDLPVGVAVHRDGAFVWVNRELWRALGYEGPDAMIGTSARKLAQSAEWTKAATGPNQAARASMRTELARTDGSSLDVMVYAYPIHFDGLPATLVVTEDQSAQRDLSTRLMQVDRMLSVGLLAGGLGHEINSPLSFVTANVDLALRTVAELASAPPSDDARVSERVVQLRDALSEARLGARRVRTIVEQLRAFSRPDSESSTVVDVEQAIQAAVGMTWNELRHRARVVKEISGPLAVAGNEARLGQVLLNLLTNAAHAIEPGHVDENRVTIRAERVGDRVLVEISDSGCGISEQVRALMFEPFFTTKSAGQGMGLGLPLCRSIVTDMGGEIAMEAGPRGSGTTARLTFPAAELREERRPTMSPLAESPESMRVLIVDDEPLIGRVVTRCLGRGHDVTSVCSGVEALELITNGARYDVLFLDVMMPEMTGIELHRAIEKRAPELVPRIVFLTAGAFAPAARAALDQLPNTKLSKPFEPREIREAARSVLEQTRLEAPRTG